MDYTKEIREIATKLFAEGKIDVFVGYRMTGFDENQVPVIISGLEDVPMLIFNDRSVFNLANYLKQEHTRKKRVGLIVKGCDSRSLNLLLTENQVNRERLFVIGIACEGICDQEGNKMQHCKECVFPDAVVYDQMVGTPHDARQYQVNADVRELASKSLVERREYFETVFESCIRCNACRHSCPLCYCAKCVIDQETSTLYHGSNTTSSAFHALMTWSLHLAGRCVDCRNCERACPMGLPLHLLHKQNENTIYGNFQGHLAGVVDGDRGAFYKYNMNDPDDFIM